MFAEKTRHALRENKKQSGRNEFSALLSYAYMSDDATVVHKDLGLSAHFVYQAVDVDSATGFVLDSNAEAVQKALAVLGDGWMLETNLISEKAAHWDERGDYPDPVSAMIHHSRKLIFNESKPSFHSQCYLSITYIPTGHLGKAISSSMEANGEVIQKKNKLDSFFKEKKHFEEVIDRFCTQFSKITTTGVHRLRSNNLVVYLNQCITGVKRPLKMPNVGYFLDSFLSSQDFVAGTELKTGKSFIKVLSISDIPEKTWPAILDDLNYLGFNYRWSSRFITLSKTTATKYLKSIQNRWSSKALGLIGALKMALNMEPKLDEAAQTRKEQMKQAIYSENIGELNHGFMTSNIVLVNQDKKILEEQTVLITRLIEAKGFKIRDEIINGTEAYLGSLPGHGGYNIRKPLVDSLYASHTLPTSSLWQGDRYSPNPFLPKKSPPLMLVRTRDSRTFCFNLHVKDIGHFMVLGPTGMGKSTLVGLIGCRFLKYQQARVVVFDKDQSNKIWLQSLGGQYSNLNSGFKFSPFSIINTLNKQDDRWQQEIDFLVTWLSELCELQGVKVNAERKQMLIEGIENVAESPSSHRQFSLLTVQDSELRMAIENFKNTSAGEMINGTTAINIHHINGFETGALLKLENAIFIPVLRLIFHQLTASFQDRRPTLLILEEAWSFLRHSIFETMLEDWLLTLRKFNVAVGFISQSVSHVSNSKISGAIKESCPTRIFLPNSKLIDPDLAQQYSDFGLNQQQIEIIRNAEAKREYYLNSDQGNRLFDTDLDVLTLSFIGISNPEEIKKFNEIYKNNDPSWLNQWLIYRGLSNWTPFLKENDYEN